MLGYQSRGFQIGGHMEVLGGLLKSLKKNSGEKM